MMCVIDSDNICGGGGGDTPTTPPKRKGSLSQSMRVLPEENNSLIGPQMAKIESLIDACIVITSQIKEGEGLTLSVLLLLLLPTLLASINFSWRPSRGGSDQKDPKDVKRINTTLAREVGERKK